jgi:hypothetical protein
MRPSTWLRACAYLFDMAMLTCEDVADRLAQQGGAMRLLRWRCQSAPWATSMPGETRCPFCGSQDITETPDAPVDFALQTAKFGPASAVTDRGRGDKEMALTQYGQYSSWVGGAR